MNEAGLAREKVCRVCDLPLSQGRGKSKEHVIPNWMQQHFGLKKQRIAYTPLESLDKARTTKQSIHVSKETHQHVHYHDNRRGGAESANQSHGRAARAPDECEAVWSEEPRREALPRPSGKGEGALPVSRRKGRSAKR